MDKVRATRAYVAGLGTAGSLVAGAAVLFVFASAVVSFRGWPQVGAQPSATSVDVSAAHASSGSSSTSRRLTAAVAATRSVTGTGAAAATRAGTAGNPGGFTSAGSN